MYFYFNKHNISRVFFLLLTRETYSSATLLYSACLRAKELQGYWQPIALYNAVVTILSRWKPLERTENIFLGNNPEKQEKLVPLLLRVERLHSSNHQVSKQAISAHLHIAFLFFWNAENNNNVLYHYLGWAVFKEQTTSKIKGWKDTGTQ